MQNRNSWGAVVLATFVFGGSAVSANAAGFEILAPHRAVYDVVLVNAEERSGIKQMKGRIVFEATGNECEGISIRL